MLQQTKKHILLKIQADRKERRYNRTVQFKSSNDGDW